MNDGFTEMLDEANAFFLELRAQNEKPFYEANKTRYVERIKKPAELLVTIMAEELSRLSGDAYAGKMFRIHRDVRFSKDKTPYRTHLHAVWTAEGRPAFFFASEPGELGFYVGVVDLKGERLTNLRQRIDTKGDAIMAEIAAIDGTLRDFTEPLKRVPKPYDPDHPRADLLKRKSLVVRQDLLGQIRPEGLVKTLTDAAERALPLQQLLSGL